MKSNSKVLTVFPKARYVVTASGVKMIGDGVVLNISRQQSQYVLWDLVMKYGLGKQYL